MTIATAASFFSELRTSTWLTQRVLPARSTRDRAVTFAPVTGRKVVELEFHRSQRPLPVKSERGEAAGDVRESSRDAAVQRPNKIAGLRADRAFNRDTVFVALLQSDPEMIVERRSAHHPVQFCKRKWQAITPWASSFPASG